MSLERPPHDYNPYQAPTTEIDYDEDELGLLDEPNKLEMGVGADWVGESWRIFRERPLLWIGVGLFYLIVLMMLSAIPIFGLFAGVVNILMTAGIAYIAHLIDSGEDATFGDLFVVFQHNTGQQLMLFVLNFAFTLIIVAIMGVLMAIMAGGASVFGESGNLFSATFALAILCSLLLFIPLIMSMWLSPILVLFHDMNALPAMKLSVKACLSNILPTLIFGLVMGLLIILSMIPLLLGLFVTLPMMLIASYVAYRDILTA